MGERVHEQRAYLVQFRDAHLSVKQCCLTPQEHQLQVQLLAVLEPFKEAMDVFQTTHSVVISKPYPILLQVYSDLTSDAAILVIPGAKEGIAASELLPLVNKQRMRLATSLQARWLGVNKGEAVEDFTIYGSAAYLDPRNIAVQLLFHLRLEDGTILLHHMHQAVNRLVRGRMEDVIAFLEREAARTPTAPWTTRAIIHYRKERAAVAQHHKQEEKHHTQGQEGVDGVSPPTKRLKSWWASLQAELLRECGRAVGVGEGGGVGEGRPKQYITEIVATQLFKEDLVAYGQFWKPECIAVHGLPMEKEECPLVSFWGLMKNRESMPVLCFLAHVILSLQPSSADTEHLFSDSSLTLSERRQSLDAQRLDDLVVVKENWDYFHLKFTKEKEENKRKMRVDHNKNIGKGMKKALAVMNQQKVLLQKKIYDC